MTAQVPDRLLYEGEMHPLYSNPLEPYWDASGGRPRFVEPRTCNWRDYVATWEIREGRLWLIGLQGEAVLDERGQPRTEAKSFMDRTLSETLSALQTPASRIKVMGLADLFPDQPEGAVAWWFSGRLHVPEGKCVYAVNMGYESIHERERVFTIVEGRVVGVELVPTGEEWRKKVEETRRSREVVRTVRPDPQGWVKCPHCEWRFSLENRKSLDGDRHRRCWGRIRSNSEAGPGRMGGRWMRRCGRASF